MATTTTIGENILSSISKMSTENETIKSTPKIETHIVILWDLDYVPIKIGGDRLW